MLKSIFIVGILSLSFSTEMWASDTVNTASARGVNSGEPSHVEQRAPRGRGHGGRARSRPSQTFGPGRPLAGGALDGPLPRIPSSQRGASNPLDEDEADG